MLRHYTVLVVTIFLFSYERHCTTMDIECSIIRFPLAPPSINQYGSRSKTKSFWRLLGDDPLASILKFALTALGSISQRLSTTDLCGFHWGARRLPRRHRARALAHIPERASWCSTITSREGSRTYHTHRVLTEIPNFCVFWIPVYVAVSTVWPETSKLIQIWSERRQTHPLLFK